MSEEQKRFFRALIRADQMGGTTGEPIEFVASTANAARDKIEIDQAGWKLDNYRKNPVVLWMHDYWGERPPIGRAEVSLSGNELICRIWFDQGDPFAVDVERKYRNGFLNAVSVGWDTLEWTRLEEGEARMRVTSAELLDISAVSVPGDPDALMRRTYDALKKAGYPLPTSPLEGGGERKKTGEDVWEEVAAEMAAIFDQACEDPDEERERRYNSLLPKYRRLGKTAPEFLGLDVVRALSQAELAGLFLEGEVAPPLKMERAGAVLSKANLDDLHSVMAQLEEAGNTLAMIISRAQKAEEEEDPSTSSDKDSERSGQVDPSTGSGQDRSINQENEKLQELGLLLRCLQVQLPAKKEVQNG